MSKFFLLYVSGLALFANSYWRPSSIPEDNVPFIIHHTTIVDVNSGLLLKGLEIYSEAQLLASIRSIASH